MYTAWFSAFQTVTSRTNISDQVILSWTAVLSGNDTATEDIRVAPNVQFSDWSECSPFVWFGQAIAPLSPPSPTVTVDQLNSALANLSATYNRAIAAQKMSIDLAYNIAIAAIVFGVLAFVMVLIVAAVLFKRNAVSKV